MTGTRFLIHQIAEAKSRDQVLPACFATYCFDLRDVNFSVSSVTQDDVIHANKKDIDLIFKLSGSGIHRTTSGSNHVIYNELLIKALTQSERKKDGGVKGLACRTVLTKCCPEARMPLAFYLATWFWLLEVTSSNHLFKTRLWLKVFRLSAKSETSGV